MVASDVKAMFLWLREVRLTAQAANQLHVNKAVVTTEFLWASGQCHMRMNALMQASFKNHPVISTALNQHLFEHRVPMLEHEALMKQVAVLEQQSSLYKRTLDSHTISIVNLQRHRNRGGGGGNSGGRGGGAGE